MLTAHRAGGKRKNLEAGKNRGYCYRLQIFPSMLKNPFFRSLFLGVFCAAAWFAPRAEAQVLLRLAPAGGLPVVVNPGGTFSFEVSIEAQGLEEIEGFSYYLNAKDGVGVEVSNVFSILDRASNTALFSANELFWTDGEVATPPDSVLAPNNGLDLGAFLEAPLAGPNAFLLGTYTVQAAPSLPVGTYFLAPVLAVWISGGDEFSFNALDTLSVTVVPEPSAGVLLFLGLGLLGARKAGSRRA